MGKPGGRQYTLNHGKGLVEAITAGIEPLEGCRKVESEMRFNLVVHDPDALFNIIDQQRRDQAVLDAKDAARRQTATRVTLDQWLLRRPKLQVNVADKHDGSHSGKAGRVNAERNRRYETNEYFVCGKQGHKQ